MKTFYLISIALICIVKLSAQEDSILHQSYQKYNSLHLTYQGFQGNTIGVSYGITKECNYCDQTNIKFWGLGLELGTNIEHEIIIGTKLVAERGENFLGIRGSFLILTSNFKEYGYIVRPEILVYPIKKRKITLGLAYNFGRNFMENKFLFGIVQFNIGVNLKLK